MTDAVEIPVDAVVPEIGEILEGQGVPRNSDTHDRLYKLGETGQARYKRAARPAGLLRGISIEEFAEIYPGEGQNEEESPLAEIYPQARHLFLFAVTVGDAVSQEIADCFDEGDFALGTMIDTAASYGAEMAGSAVRSHCLEWLRGRGKLRTKDGVLPFSPGYCGWHVSGQKRLFRCLEPESIGIRLNRSSLMQPLKSISGVIVVGRKSVFEFDSRFSFCGVCETHACRERIDRVRRQQLV